MGRMVGVTGTNLLNNYFTMLNLALSDGCEKLTPNAKGDVVIDSLDADAFCVEPVRAITSAGALSDDVYFVPAFDFKGINVNDTEIDVTDVNANGVDLYVLSSGAVTKVSL